MSFPFTEKTPQRALPQIGRGERGSPDGINVYDRCVGCGSLRKLGRPHAIVIDGLELDRVEMRGPCPACRPDERAEWEAGQP